MNINLLLILVCAAVACAVICLVDRCFYATSRQQAQTADPVLVDNAKAFLPIFILVLIIRSFFGQAFRVPTQSLEPTVVPGDLVAVSMFSYGLRTPVWPHTLLHVGKPQRGDIMLFFWPVDAKFNFIKRVIGLPGDHISYKNKILTINGKTAAQTFVKNAIDTNGGPSWQVKEYQENLLGVKHNIYRRPDAPAQDFKDYVVPAGHYFMMGDNRDNSDDSRMWGPVAWNDIVGKGKCILINWFHTNTHYFRLDRVGTSI